MKNIYRLVSCLLLGLVSIVAVHSEDIEKASYNQIVANRFSKQIKIDPQEKVYLQTDKPYYSAGEEIWFKGYLVNAVSNIPKTISQYLYVELIDKLDSVHYRVKIKKDSLGFAGCIKLKPEIASGNYAIRAYTYWMQNAGKDFFFSKNIYIGNNIDDRITCQALYGDPLNGKVAVSITFTGSSQTSIANKKVSIDPDWTGSNRKNTLLTTNKDGKINWTISVDSVTHASKSFEVAINDPDIKFKKRFFIPDFNLNFDVQFFPESGTLLSDNLHSIAFKAIGRNGLSVEVTGKVFTDKDEDVTEFSSIHKGMGKFILETKAGENYYASIKSAAGIEKRFTLPPAQSMGAAIHLGYNKGRIVYKVINQTGLADSSLYLLIHSRGIAYVVQQLSNKGGQILESLFPNGIVSFAIIDSTGNTWCERLAFIRNSNQPVVKMQSDKAVYGKRDAVNLSLNVQSLLAKPVTGSYSIRITDSKTVKLDSLGDNILNYLLLSSDIKGYVEEPAGYFKDNTTVTREKTDILMMTQGWRRFNTADVVKGIYKQPDYYLEAGQALSGKVLNILGKPVKESDILMLSPYKGMIRTSHTNSAGKYLIEGIEFPDSTIFILKARKKKSFGDVEIVPDADAFPLSTASLIVPLTESMVPPADYFRLSKEKYYSEGGMRIVNLEEVTVKANRKTEESSDQFYSGMADTQITSESLEKFAGMSLLNVFSTIAGVMVIGDQISIRGSRNNPLFMIDGIETENIEDLSYLTTNDVDNISVFKGADAAIFGSRGGNGVIAIALKKGVVLKAGTPISMATIKPLGYQKPTQFYVPKYEVDSVRMNPKTDLRTTIYWNPTLVADSTGTVHVKFFTADQANDYSVVFEGITAEGEICRYVGYLRRKGE